MRYNLKNNKAEFVYFQLPKSIHEDEKYRKLSTEAKYLYMLMYDMNKLSIANGMADKNGDVYIFFTIERIMKEMNVGKAKAIALKKELSSVKLIEEVRQGLKHPNIIYVNIAEETESNQLKYENQTSGSTKNGLLGVPKSDSNNNKNNKNKKKINKEKGFSFDMDIDY